MKLAIILVCALYSATMNAAVPTLSFKSPEHEARYYSLLDELRCLVCQNQNLADSNAELAQDLRNQTYKMIQDDRLDSEIVEYMVERYGDFVLYRTPLKTATIFLWYGPLVLLIIAIAVYWSYITRFRKQAKVDISDEDRERVKKLLGE